MWWQFLFNVETLGGWASISSACSAFGELEPTVPAPVSAPTLPLKWGHCSCWVAALWESGNLIMNRFFSKHGCKWVSQKQTCWDEKSAKTKFFFQSLILQFSHSLDSCFTFKNSNYSNERNCILMVSVSKNSVKPAVTFFCRWPMIPLSMQIVLEVINRCS